MKNKKELLLLLQDNPVNFQLDAKDLPKDYTQMEWYFYKKDCKCTPDETTGWTDFKDELGRVCNICGGAVK